MSRIGKLAIAIPDGFKIDLTINNQIHIKGKLGEMNHVYPKCLKIIQDNNFLLVKRNDDSRESSQMQGLFRSLIFNSVTGLNEKFQKTLELIGVGYRAQLSGNILNLNLGYSHPVIMDIPNNLDVKIEGSNTIHISGIDKQKVGLFASQIRDKRPPEPYKGKGVRYLNEVVLRKAGKSGK